MVHWKENCESCDLCFIKHCKRYSKYLFLRDLVASLALLVHQGTTVLNLKLMCNNLFLLTMYTGLELLVFWVAIAFPANGTETTVGYGLLTHDVRLQPHLEDNTTQQNARVMHPMWRRGTQRSTILSLTALTTAVTIAYLVLRCLGKLNSRWNAGTRRHSERQKNFFGSCGVSYSLYPDS